ncbi:hypothetical protein GEMRC1_013101 [Eukaryota sp. GEM-RC1]
MRVCVTGCVHGCLDSVYNTLGNESIDLVICTGDFQAVRNESDLISLSCPTKYLKYGDFLPYYNKQKTAPVLTLVIGGNHEASSFFAELKDGGWLCHNIYFLGFSGVVKVGGLTIAGLSGIHNQLDFYKGYSERFPLNESGKRSIYHVRQFEVAKLLALKDDIDIFVSHDWPRDITTFGDTTTLFRLKPYLRKDVRANSLGCSGLQQILDLKQPSLMFSSHHHVKWDCVSGSTSFMALSHVERFPKQAFHFFEIPSTGNRLEYHPEWLAIVKKSQQVFPHFKTRVTYTPDQFVVNQGQIDDVMRSLPSLLVDRKDSHQLSSDSTEDSLIEVREVLNLKSNWNGHFWKVDDLHNNLVTFT